MNLLDTSRVFDVPGSDGITTVTVKNLTLKQKDEVYRHMEEAVKERKRKEYMALSAYLQGKERMAFLVEAAGSTKVTAEEVISEAQTVDGIAYTLDMVCAPKLDWKTLMADELILDFVLKCYYWSLNVDVPDFQEPEPQPSPEATSEGAEPPFARSAGNS